MEAVRTVGSLAAGEAARRYGSAEAMEAVRRDRSLAAGEAERRDRSAEAVRRDKSLAAGEADRRDRSAEAVRRDRSLAAGEADRSARSSREPGPGDRPRSAARCGALALLLLAACGRPPELTGAELEAAARTLWQTRCANCHGADGRGDGPTGRGLRARPRDFHDVAWQAGVDDVRLRRVIVEGGAAHGLSADMAANPDLEDRPATVDALVRIVRGFRDAPPAP